MSEPSEQKARQVLGLDDFTEEDIAALEAAHRVEEPTLRDLAARHPDMN